VERETVQSIHGKATYLSSYVIQLFEDRLEADAVWTSLPPRNRVLYVVQGTVEIEADRQARQVTDNDAWFGIQSCTVKAGPQGARIWRWELIRPPATGESQGDERVNSRLLERSEIELDPEAEYLMRCDRVDFPLGGVAYLHTHGGPGIRCLLQGEITIRVEGNESRIKPGESWFERGSDPVFAAASDAELTSFIRGMILPISLQEKSSISYVDPEDRDKPKTQQYTRFVDEPIEI
jgi:quercetin dioxygenase-like cupin family protein